MVNFPRSAGISVQGAEAGYFRLIKPPKSGGYSVDVDCSLVPGLCPGSKTTGKLTMIGATSMEEVIDYCNDEIDACVAGPD